MGDDYIDELYDALEEAVKYLCSQTKYPGDVPDAIAARLGSVADQLPETRKSLEHRCGSNKDSQ